jgi:hypothetical protein
MSGQLYTVVNGGKSIPILFKHFTVVILMDDISLKVVAPRTDDLSKTFVLRISENVDGEDIAIREGR